MKLDYGPESGIDDDLHDLPYHLQKADTTGVCVSLGYQYQDGPPQLLQNIPGTTHILDYVHELHPPSRFVGGFLSLSWICPADPRLELICAEVGVSA